MIKLDVEGYETKALLGGIHQILQQKPILMIETVDSQLKNHGSNLIELRNLLHKLGYKKIWAAQQDELYIRN